MEHHSSNGEYPAIEVIVSRGKEDICVKMSDKGGGIPRSQMDHLFKYMYSTAPRPTKTDAHTVPLAGYGYGLPVSRLYARYFHGDLVLQSCDGFGTDAIVYLKALSNEANELLPIFNKTSSKFYRTQVSTTDWSSHCGGGMATRQLRMSHVQGHKLHVEWKLGIVNENLSSLWTKECFSVSFLMRNVLLTSIDTIGGTLRFDRIVNQDNRFRCRWKKPCDFRVTISVKK